MIGYCIRKLRQWGLQGVLLHVSMALSRRAFRLLLDNAKAFPVEPTRGITLLADLPGRASLCKACGSTLTLFK